MNTERQSRIVTFLDAVQRTIIAERVDEECNENLLVVKNPVVVNILPQVDPVTRQQTGQMALQLIPLFFREFMGDKSETVVLSYPRNQVTQIAFKGGFDFRLYAQYEHIFDSSGIVVPDSAGSVTPATENPKSVIKPVLKLFE